MLRRVASAIGVLVVLGAFVQACPNGVYAEYTRLFHDCADDYGWHAGYAYPQDPGRDTGAVDVVESSRLVGDEQTPLVVFRLTVGKRDAPDLTRTREELSFRAPSGVSVGTVIDSTDGESGAAPSLVASESVGPLPVFVSGVLDAYYDPGFGSGVHPARLSYEVGYRYADLKAADGAALRGSTFRVLTFHKTPATAWTKGDIGPGGKWTAGGTLDKMCDVSETTRSRDRDWYVRDAYVMEQSSWAPTPPEAGFGFSPQAPTTADIVQFTDGSTDPDGAITEWSWAFGDGATSAKRHPTHQYVRAGTYAVTLAVKDNDGTNASATHDVTVLAAPLPNQAPTAAFTHKPASPATDDTVQFTDGSTDPDGAITEWSWAFGDGATSAKRHPTHQYARADTYTVTLVVKDDVGASASATRNLTVEAAPPPNQAPTATFTYAPASPTTADAIEFTDGSTDPDGAVTAWSWSFGGGGTSTDQNATHRFTRPGTYAVSLAVTDDAGASSAITRNVTVAARPPVAKFGCTRPGEQSSDATVAPSCEVGATTRDEIHFEDASTGPDGVLVSWKWDFGDGTTSALQHPAHRYSQAGAYTITLVVTDDAGATAFSSRNVAVTTTPPFAGFRSEPLDPEAGDTIRFTDESRDEDGSIAARSWEFGDGTSSAQRNPTHQYASGGAYTVRLTVIDNDGAVSTASKRLAVAVFAGVTTPPGADTEGGADGLRTVPAAGAPNGSAPQGEAEPGMERSRPLGSTAREEPRNSVPSPDAGVLLAFAAWIATVRSRKK